MCLCEAYRRRDYFAFEFCQDKEKGEEDAIDEVTMRYDLFFALSVFLVDALGELWA